MSIQRIACAFFSFILVMGLLPSFALAQPLDEVPGEEVNAGIEAGNSAGSPGEGSGDNPEEPQQPSVPDDEGIEEKPLQSSEQESNNEQLENDASGEVPLNADALSLKAANTVQNGIYLLTPAANSGLNFGVSSSALAATTAPRNDALTFSFNAEGIASIQDNAGNYLTAQGSSLIFSAQSSELNQQWQFLDSGNGSYVIRNVATQTVLDVKSGNIANGTKVQLYQANGTAAQNWNLYEVGSTIDMLDAKAAASKGLLDTDTVYYLETALMTNKVADVAAASTANRANVQLYDFNKTGAQQWKVRYDEKGYVTFFNVSSGKVLDVNAGSAVSGTNVHQYENNGSLAQKWIVSKNEDGTYSIESALWADLSLDLAAASTANKTNIRLYASNGTAAQAFNLISEASVYAGLDEKAAQNVDVLTDGTYLINSALAKNKVLDVKSGSAANGANVQIYESNLTNAQKWEVTHDEKGYVTFINTGSGKVLDVASASIAPRSNVQQYLSNGSLAQKWIVSKNEDGTYSIESALWSGISLDVAGASSANGANIQIYNSNGTSAQSFSFINTNPQVEPCDDLGLGEKYFKIASAANNSYVMDIASGSMDNGANVQLYSDNGTYAQLFTFKFIKTEGNKGFYQIINAKSEKALDVDSGNLVNGTNVQQWDADAGNANGLFSISQNEDGTYTFVNKASGLAVDVAGGSAADKTNIQGYTPNGSVAQNFNLIEVSDFLPEGIVTIYSALSSSKVIDVASGSMNGGANVQLYSSNGSLAQKWNVTRVSDNTYTIQSVRSGMNLSVTDDGNVIQSKPSDDDAQKWTASISMGYTVLKNLKTGKVLDVASASTANGANIQTYDANNTNAQRFNVSQVALLNSGLYEIQAFGNIDYVVDVASGSSANGANIQLYKSNNSGAQKWNVVQNSDGSYTFKNAVSGKALDLQSGQAFDGSNIQLWSTNSSAAAQKWFPEYVDGGGIRLVSAVDRNYSIGIAGGSYANGANIELQASTDSQSQRFTFEKTSPPLPADQLDMYNHIVGHGSGTQWIIGVDRANHRVGIFKGSANNWSIQYFWSCTTGAPSSPTITGVYSTTGFKRMSLSTDYRARWCTQIWSGYFFHTILASEGELGHSLSHGCIRLPYSAAQWIYNNIYAGTTVVIYN